MNTDESSLFGFRYIASRWGLAAMQEYGETRLSSIENVILP